ncbi:unnamed protein product [Triticum turgidum subsp. durum]|uniref:Uncharacterized protein n=1 Tax=Triticum turgidum subsp. durum TaxID=4567 RepID=A0A9R0X398_TRITD|nr:unnamed protein product [Triticum turgidum subsp. durum]
MASRVGLLLAPSSSLALNPPRPRLPYPLLSHHLGRPTYRRIASSAPLRSPLWWPRQAPSLFAARAMSGSAGSPPYAAELAAAKKAVALAARLCQTVQQEILQSDIQSKADKSPVTVADYGSQVLVSLVLNMEVTSGSFSMVAEEIECPFFHVPYFS